MNQIKINAINYTWYEIFNCITNVEFHTDLETKHFLIQSLLVKIKIYYTYY